MSKKSEKHKPRTIQLSGAAKTAVAKQYAHDVYAKRKEARQQAKLRGLALDGPGTDSENSEDEHTQLEQAFLKEYERTQKAKSVARRQAEHNQLMNAQAGRKLESYDRAAEERKRQKDLLLQVEKPKIELPEKPLVCIRRAIEATMNGKIKTVEYLRSAECREAFDYFPLALLMGSMLVDFRTRHSPIYLRVTMIWRLSIILSDFFEGNRINNLKLAAFGFMLLRQICDAERHSCEYSALWNSLEQIEIDIRRMQGIRATVDANRFHSLEHLAELRDAIQDGATLLTLKDALEALPAYLATQHVKRAEAERQRARKQQELEELEAAALASVEDTGAAGRARPKIEKAIKVAIDQAETAQFKHDMATARVRRIGDELARRLEVHQVDLNLEQTLHQEKVKEKMVNDELENRLADSQIELLDEKRALRRLLKEPLIEAEIARRIKATQNLFDTADGGAPDQVKIQNFFDSELFQRAEGLQIDAMSAVPRYLLEERICDEVSRRLESSRKTTEAQMETEATLQNITLDELRKPALAAGGEAVPVLDIYFLVLRDRFRREILSSLLLPPAPPAASFLPDTEALRVELTSYVYGSNYTNSLIATGAAG